MTLENEIARFRAKLVVLRRRDFRLLYMARLLSIIGDGFATVGVAFAVLEITGSATALGLVLFARAIPYALLVAGGGVLADRVARRLIMLGADTVCTVSQGVLAVLVLTGTARLWEMIVLYAVYGTAQAMYKPAQSGIVPQTIDRDQLPQANALLAIGFSTGEILGPATAGVVIALTRPGWGIAVDAVSFLIGGLLVSRMRTPAARESVERGTFLQDFAEGWAAVRHLPWLSSGIFYWAIFQFLTYGGLFVLGPLVADRSLGGAAAWGTMLAGQGVGLAAGSLISFRFQPRRLLLGLWLTVAALATPVFVLLAIPAPIPLLFIGFVLYGVSGAYAWVVWTVAIQQEVPSERLSRVAGLDEMLSSSLRPVGLAVFGPLAGLLGLGTVLVSGGSVVLIGALVVLAVPGVRELARLEPDKVMTG